jgi:processive 1,2-diacylglycerol beta-glucosyltransferase/1,2-diacylglycerol 3-beta-galactosyltransferase
VSAQKKIVFLYLDTGGGHKAPAKALSDWINGHQGQRAKAVLHNGVSPKNFIAQAILEQGYRLVTTRMSLLWKSFYDLSQPKIVLFLNSISITLIALTHLMSVIRAERPDTVVSCHFLLNTPLKILRRLMGFKFKVLTLCTDPFTIHPFWFYKQNGTVLLFSKIARDEIIVSYRIDSERVPVFPWVMQEKFSAPLAPGAIPGVRSALGLSPSKKTVVISGGGEGLPGTEKYFKALLASNQEFDLVVICGKNKAILRHCRDILKKNPTPRKVQVLGFTPRMYEYINCADLIVSKAGTSTIMETLMMGKPLIIPQYLYGQEFGNAAFVVRKGLGAYTPKPSDLRLTVEKLLGDTAAYERIVDRIRRANLRNGTADVARYILDFTDKK